MLSRFVRSAPVRQCVRSAIRTPRYFSQAAIDATVEGVTEQQLLDQIKTATSDDNSTCFIEEAGDFAYELKPVSDTELLDTLAQQGISEDQAGEQEGFLDAIGLGPFHRKAALLSTGALTALSNEFYVLNEETFVAACLVSGFTVMYINLREPLLEAYETFQQETLKAQTEAEEKHIAACRTLINAQQGGENLVDAVRDAFAEKEALINAEAAARAIAERNKVAKDYDGRLQALVNRKSDAENKAYRELIDTVYEDVLATAQSDKKFKKSALKYALTAISTPEKAGANPTVELYSSKLSQ